jgi:hypothetical protein
MNNPNNDIQPEETPAEIQQPEVQVVEAPPIDNRRRLRELLSIPERDRSDEQWDEIIELEIQMAPGNRISGAGEPMGGQQQRQQPRQQQRQQPRQQRSGGGQHGGGGNFTNASGDSSVPGVQEKKHRPRTKTNRRPRQGGKPDGGAGGTPA